MAKSIIDIDVNDKSFVQFQKLFNTYQQQLKQTPLQWAKAAQGQAKSVELFKDMVAERAKAIQGARMAAEAEKVANRLLRSNADIWRDMRRTTAGVAGNVASITGQLLRWSGVVGAISGLLGAGGLFGVSRLAEGVASGRRGSLGLGSSYGQNSAFSNAYSRVADPSAVLGGTADALGDVTKRVAFYQAGLGEKDLAGGPAAVGSRLLASLRRKALGTPDELLGTMANVWGAGQFGIGANELRVLKHTSNEEFSGLQKRFGAGSSNFDVTGKDQRAYQEFVTALDTAGRKIETVFVKGLAPLIPGLEKLSDSAAKAVETLLGSFPKDWAETAGKGIEDVAKYLGSQEFRDGIKTFAEGVIWIGKKFATIGGFVANHTNTVDKNAPEFSGAYGQVPESGGQAKANRILNGIFGTRVKRGAGEIDAGLGALASAIDQRVTGIKQFTAFNDDFHKGRNSAHNDGRAFDLTLSDPSRSADVAESIRRILAEQKIAGSVIDEYKNPSPGSTGGHIHVQTDVRVTNATGNNIVVQSNQAAVPQ